MNSKWKRILTRVLFTLFFFLPLVFAVEVPLFLAGAGLGTYLVYSRDLPVIPNLPTYQPRTVSTFYADDGTVIGQWFKEKRFVVELEQMPQHVINAFLAAEDARFWEHHGVDWQAMARAMLRNLKAGRIVQGGGTITMQVMRNFVLTQDRSFDRKIKEMILATRVEKIWGKKKVLYVYLNEIFLGEKAYGVEAAARTYFHKPVEHLTIAEAALIAGLVASPSRYNPFKSEERARERQSYVLGRMLRVGFISDQEFRLAKAQPLTFKREVIKPLDLTPDFTEVVRRHIVRKYGEEKLYYEGLKVFTTCRIDYQRQAMEAVEKGVEEIKARQKFLAILRTVPQGEITELLKRRRTPELGPNRVYQGVVVRITQKKTKEVELDVGISDRMYGKVPVVEGISAYKVGQVLALRFDKFVGEIPHFTLDRDPKLQSALVCIENRTGYVRALIGGAYPEHFQFNRATQAKRQPGSAFKPFIYSVAIEHNSYSPATIIVDEPIVVDLEGMDEEWEPRNAGGDFLGPVSLRRALELSRNICTIKILMDVRVEPVIELANRMGITSPLGNNLSLSLGTSELSLFELASAYTVFPNAGVYVEPVLVKRIEDRFGNVLEDNSTVPVLEDVEIPKPTPRKEFEGLVASSPDPTMPPCDDEEDVEIPDQQPTRQPQGPVKQEPTDKKGRAKALLTCVPAPHGRVHPALSPETAYIMTRLMQGGVQVGTGARLGQYVKRKDLAGKTGTTNNAEDAWFIGFNPEFTTGVWVGFDEKRPIGRREEGAKAALPIWGYFMKAVLESRPEREFPVPPSITFKDMLTYGGSVKEGFVPKPVREPVYKPFAGKTLVVSPLDTQTLASYRGAVTQPGPGQPGVQPAPPGWQFSQPRPDGAQPVQPVQPGQTVQPAPVVPIYPADGRAQPPQDPRVNPNAPRGPVVTPWQAVPGSQPRPGSPYDTQTQTPPPGAYVQPGSPQYLPQSYKPPRGPASPKKSKSEAVQ